MRTITFIIGSWLLGLAAATGQSFEQDMAAMNAVYKDVDALYVELENSVWEDQKRAQQQAAVISKKNGAYLYEMKEATMLINKQYILMINHLNKTIVYDKWTKKKAAALAQQQIPTAADLKAQYPSITYVGQQDDQKKYRLENEQQQMSKVEVSFEAATGFMRKIRYYYNPALVHKNIYTELHLKVIQPNPSFEANTFSEQRFITKVNGQFKGVGKYRAYSVQSAQ